MNIFTIQHPSSFVHGWIIHVCFVLETILPTVWCSRGADEASMRANFYWYFLCNIDRWHFTWKMRAPRRGSYSLAPHIVTWTKHTWIIHPCIVLASLYSCCKRWNHSFHLQNRFLSKDNLFIDNCNLSVNSDTRKQW